MSNLVPRPHLVLNPRTAPPAADRILVIRLGALGDVVRTLPAVASLRSHYRDAEITWLVEERTESIVANRSLVDRVLVFPRARIARELRELRPVAAMRALASFAAELRAPRFDLVVDFHAIARSAMLARWSGARQRACYAAPTAREGAWLAANLRAELVPGPLTRFERNDALVRFLGIEPLSADSVFGLAAADLDPAARARVDAALGDGPPPVVVHPGSSSGAAYKRWPRDHWVSLLRELGRSRRRVLVCAGPAPDERALALMLVEAAGGAASLAPATDGFDELAALLERAELFIGADSGPLHVASLSGTPVVQIVGPTHPIENRPHPSTPFRQVRAGLECSPCRRGCAAAACMRSVEVERVLEAVRSLGNRVAPARVVP